MGNTSRMPPPGWVGAMDPGEFPRYPPGFAEQVADELRRGYCPECGREDGPPMVERLRAVARAAKHADALDDDDDVAIDEWVAAMVGLGNALTALHPGDLGEDG